MLNWEKVHMNLLSCIWRELYEAEDHVQLTELLQGGHGGGETLTSISIGTVHTIIYEDLKKTIVFAKFVLRIQRDNQKLILVQTSIICCKMLQHHLPEGLLNSNKLLVIFHGAGGELWTLFCLVLVFSCAKTTRIAKPVVMSYSLYSL